MRIEGNNDLQPILDDYPFFENHLHCESWVDEALLILDTDTLKIEPKNIVQIKSHLQYAKELLNSSDENFPTQEEIDLRFRPLVRETYENKESWGDLGGHYRKVWNYLRMKMVAENQD